jgi:WD40 repeat protein
MNSTFIGHKGSCFDIKFSRKKDHFITASEDGCSKVWNTESKKCLSTINHDKKYEVLRSCFLQDDTGLVCTCGSDGVAKVWSLKDDRIEYTEVAKLNYSPDSQIYVCEKLTTNNESAFCSQIITAANNQLNLWDLNSPDNSIEWQIENKNLSNPFGGERNVENIAYIFDAKVHPTESSNKVVVAVSDGTLRMLDVRDKNVDNMLVLNNISMKRENITSVLFIFYVSLQ